MASFFIRRNQLQWLALVAIAVLLPTVSLLWFMRQVITNERLAVRQKLSVLYQDKLNEASVRSESIYQTWLSSLDTSDTPGDPYSLLRRLVLEDQMQGMVLWDADGAIVYPTTTIIVGNDVAQDNPLGDAWKLEFVKRQYAQAAEAYAKLADHAEPNVALAAMTAQARCLSKLGKQEEALTVCERAAFAPSSQQKDLASRIAVQNARLLLLSLLEQSDSEPQNALLQRTISALVTDLYHSNGSTRPLPANQNLLLAKRTLEALDASLSHDDSTAKDELEKLSAAESLSLAVVESLLPRDVPIDTVFRIDVQESPLFGLRHRTENSTMLVLFDSDGLASLLGGYQEAFTGSEAVYRILDPSGKIVAGMTEPQGQPFTVAALPLGFPGWKAELYFAGGDIFEKAAKRRVAFYTWTGFLVILLILIVGAIATRTVGRQIRLNEMKNDFIATVTHELKTPLASMRVLVDTILEGRVKDQEQVHHYLQLASRENERLSRMIDNFLTFSRMERDKVAFTLADAQPDAIARDAIESVQTKYTANGCKLTTDIPETLPVIHADHDALVTVLVNLLDNACKYTNEDKQVTLKISSDPESVSFAVIDNGIGLTRRNLRRIFDRFYQVDSSLARKAEGCGLGLSIVEFIVDAHRGRILVDSKPGRGSTFTVRIPIGRKHSD